MLSTWIHLARALGPMCLERTNKSALARSPDSQGPPLGAEEWLLCSHALSCSGNHHGRFRFLPLLSFLLILGPLVPSDLAGESGALTRLVVLFLCLVPSCCIIHSCRFFRAPGLGFTSVTALAALCWPRDFPVLNAVILSCHSPHFCPSAGLCQAHSSRITEVAWALFFLLLFCFVF